MNAKDLTLAAFVTLTVVFASLTLNEYSELNRTASTKVTTTVTITCPINRICGSFTYNTSGSPVQVNSVEANNGSVNSQSFVGFDVKFENIGNYPIYIPAGSTGVSISVPANSPVLVAYPTECCSQVFEIAKLNPDQSYAMGGPPCGDGIEYALAQAGSVRVILSFNWTTSASASTYPNDFPNSTIISAQFIFP